MLLSTLLLALLPSSRAFSFSASRGNGTQCGTVEISWTGGTPPFRLLVIPAYDYPTNISIPDTAYSDGSGSYSWTVNYPAKTEYVLLMSDSTGIGTGGVSPLHQVGAGTSSCAMRSTNTDFLFYLNETSVDQCGPVQIYWDKSATAPVTILGAIPGGQPFMFQSTTSNFLDWNTNIAAGSQFILAAFDQGKYGNGGSSALMTVGAGGFNACLDDTSPSSTPVSNPTASQTGSTKTTDGGVKTVTAITTAQPTGAAGLSTGAIAGIAIAAVIVVLVLQGVLFYFCCRKQLAALISHRRQMRGREVKDGDVDLVDDLDGEHGASHLGRARTRETNRMSLTYTGARTRSDGDTHDADSISPYFDTSRTSTYGPFDTPPEEDDLVPPQRRHLRDASMSSRQSTGTDYLNLNLDMSPSSVSLPHLGPGDSPSDHGTPSSRHSLLPYMTPPSLSNPGPSSSSSKARMAATLSAQNPDQSHEGFGAREPRTTFPADGFRIHEDAGRIEDRVEDLPPSYRPEWETESQRGRGGSD